MDSIIFVMTVAIIAVAIIPVVSRGYKFVCNVIMRHRECTQKDIEDDIWRKWNKSNPNPIGNIVFTNKASNIMQIVLGEQRYKNLCNIANDYRIIDFSSADVCCLNILAPYDTEKEKEQFEAMLLNALKQYLNSQGIVSNVSVCWRESPVLKLPYVQFFYANDLRQKQVLKHLINDEVSKNVNNLSTKPPIDDEEDDIL